MSEAILKDGKRYFFNSKKFTSLNSLYGIDDYIKKEVNEKLENQTEYLKNHYVELNETKYISFLDMSRSANIKPNQYYGEMFNKVSSLREYAKEIGFTSPVFMTITPPSYLKPLKQINLKRNRVKLVDNPRFSGELEYVNEARKYQSEKWTKFLNQRIIKDIKKKYGERLIYMRTYEPMIDGTPHVHIVAFIPPEFLDRFVKLAKKYFSETRFDIKTVFEEDIGGVIAYILKYILKSFSNSKTNELDDVGYWYAYHGIRRFTTSRTLIPLKFFRLICSKEKYQDLLEVTKLYKNDLMSYELDYDKNKLEFTNYEDLKSTDFKVSEISVLIDDGIDTYFEVIYKKAENIGIYTIEKNQPHKPKVIKKLDHTKPIKVQIDNEYYILQNDVLIKIVPTPSKMKSFDLYSYYKKLDLDTCNLQHFGLCQNELRKRGWIDGDYQSLNDFNCEIGA